MTSRRAGALAVALGLAGLGGQLADEGEGLLDVLVAELDRGEHVGLDDLGRPDLDHVESRPCGRPGPGQGRSNPSA